MANRYLVAGGSGLWNATDTNNWSATSGGASGASCPTSSDDVFLDAGSAGASIGCQATATAANVDCTGFTGTFSWGGAVSTTWGGSWTFSAGMTVNGVAFSTQVFTGTGTHTITSAGKQFGNFTINSSGGSYTLQDALTVGASGTATLTFTRGTLDTNGNTVAAGGFSSNNGNTRTLTLGASALNMSTTAPWNVGTTNLTLTANTSVVTCSASGASFITWQNFNWGGMSLVFTGGSANTAVATNLTFANFTFTGTAIKTGVLTLYGNITTTGTLTINGNSTTNRVLIASNTVGTARTITAATVSCSNVDFMDITGAGAASPFTGTSLGNALGNSGITFTTPVTRYGVVAGNWSNTATWSSTSGGGGGSSVPLCHDTVILDASSAAGTYTADMPRMGASVTCTGFTRTLSCTSTSNTIYGDWTLGSGMTLTSTQALVLAGRSSYTLTSAGKSFGSSITINAPGGSYQMQDALTAAGAINHSYGGLDFNSQTITINNYSSLTAATRSLTGGTATINITAATASNVYIQDITNLTQSMTNTNIVLATASNLQRDIVGNGHTIGTLTYTVANSPGIMYVRAGNSSIGALNVGSGRALWFQPSTTTTIRDGTLFNVNGAVHGYNYMPGITGNYMSTPDSAALDITGDITAVAKVNMPDWTPASSGSNTFLCKWNTTGNQRSYAFQINAAGRLEFYWSVAGAVLVGTTATASVPFTDGQTGYVAASLDVDNGASGYDLKFWTSTDGTTWTQLGTTIVGGATTSIFAGTALLEIGSLIGGTASLMTGKMIQAQVYDGLRDLNAATGGTLVFDANLATKTVGADTFTESSSNAATVTINGDIAKLGDGRVSILSATAASAATLAITTGTVSCDYVVVKDNTASVTIPAYAGANGVLVSGTTNWNATAPPSGSSKFMLMGVG